MSERDLDNIVIYAVEKGFHIPVKDFIDILNVWYKARERAQSTGDERNNDYRFVLNYGYVLGLQIFDLLRICDFDGSSRYGFFLKNDVLSKWFPSNIPIVGDIKMKNEHAQVFDKYLETAFKDDLINIVISVDNTYRGGRECEIPWDFTRSHTAALLIAASCLNIFDTRFNFINNTFSIKIPQDDFIKFLSHERNSMIQYHLPSICETQCDAKSGDCALAPANCRNEQ